MWKWHASHACVQTRREAVMRKFVQIVAIVLVCLVAWACGSSSNNPMSGTWKMVVSDAYAQGVPVAEEPTGTADFSDDGTFTTVMRNGEKSQTAAGTYKLEGKTLKMTFKTQDGKVSPEKTYTVTLDDDMLSFPFPEAPQFGKFIRR